MPREPHGGLPVFVDHTGRRRRRVVAVSAALGAALLASLILLLAGLFTGGPLPLPGWPASNGAGDQAGPDRPGRSASATPTPEPVRRDPTAPVAPRSPATSSSTPPPSGTARPSLSVSDRPGRGDERRANPHPDRTKSAGPK